MPNPKSQVTGVGGSFLPTPENGPGWQSLRIRELGVVHRPHRGAAAPSNGIVGVPIAGDIYGGIGPGGEGKGWQSDDEFLWQLPGKRKERVSMSWIQPGTSCCPCGQ